MNREDPEGDERRARQRSRSVIMAIGLVIFTVLMFAITIVRMGAQTS